MKRLFIEATQLHGVPSRLRMDKGTENLATVLLMTEHRGPGRGSAIQGRSVHNQRVERNWVDVKKDAINPFYDLFTDLSLSEEDGGYGMIDINNRAHLWCLHFVFLPFINQELNLFQNERNKLGLRTEHSKTPEQLFVMGMLKRHSATSTAAAAFWEGERLGNDEVLVEDVEDIIECPLSDERLEELQGLVNPHGQPINKDTTLRKLRTVIAFVSQWL